MLVPNKRNDKDYNTMMEEAFSEIPIYSSEWTNFNPSDPGVTILENLTAFAALQAEQLNETNAKVKYNLLKLAGFEPQKGAGARVLLAAEGLKENVILSANQRFMVGNICFETNKEKQLEACHIIKVMAKSGDTCKDYTYVTDPEIKISASVFGNNPQPGDEIYFAMDRLPKPQTETLFYFEVNQSNARNPLGDKEHNRFAKIEWSCYTASGFVPMNVKDETEAFLVNGEIHFRMPAVPAAYYDDGELRGYVIRGVLKKAAYDRPPKLNTVTGFLFEVCQKETKAITYAYARSSTVLVHSNLMEQGFYKVFCKEDRDGEYRLYEEVAPDTEREGRFFTVISSGNGYFELHFNKKKYGYAPFRTKNSVKVVVYDRDLMNRYYVGEVLGYDNQEFELPVKNLITDSFSLLAVRINDRGEAVYDFLKPNRKGEGEFDYYLYENEGKIRILEAADFIGARLYIASAAITSGNDGNIRSRNIFEPVGDIKGLAVFTNPCEGRGGCYMETLEDTRRRYVKDLYRPYAAVTAADYETWVRETPGLCISKVKAILNQDTNCVEVMVKPNTLEEFPKLSPDYINILNERLEQCRLLSTKIVLRQPAYLPLEVRGTVYVNSHYGDCREQISTAIKEALDFVNGPQNFGDVVQFDMVIRKIEQLECVKQVYDLAIFPQNSVLGKKSGVNIIPVSNCLCYLGSLNLEILTNE